MLKMSFELIIIDHKMQVYIHKKLNLIIKGIVREEPQFPQCSLVIWDKETFALCNVKGCHKIAA